MLDIRQAAPRSALLLFVASLGWDSRLLADVPGAPAPIVVSSPISVAQGMPRRGLPIYGGGEMLAQPHASYAPPGDAYGCGQPDGCSSCGVPAHAGWEGPAGGGDCGCHDCCGCDCCCDDCCCDWGHWYAGGGVYFFSPRWKTNPAFTTTEAVGGVAFTTQTDFDYGSDSSPVVWAGYRSEYGLGIQGRAWWYDDAEGLQLTNPGGITVASAAPLGLRNVSVTAGDALTFDSSLDIDVSELMFTYTLQVGCAWLDFAGGARHARIEQEYHARRVALNLLVDSVDSSHRFEGTGPSVSFVGRLAMTQRLALLAAFRYSLLVGTAEQEATQVMGNVLVARRFQANDDFRPVTEVELGLDYCLPLGGCDFFVQVALATQLWQGAGNSANNDLLIPPGLIVADPDHSDKNADLLLYGLLLQGGFRF